MRVKSVENIAERDWFSSAEGRFKVGLPKSIDAFSALSPEQLGANASGASYRWATQEGMLEIAFYDHHDARVKSLDVATLVNRYGERVLKNVNAKLISQREISGGVEFVSDLPSGERFVLRAIRSDMTLYSFTALLSKVPNGEELIKKAFDTFTIIPRADIEENLKRQIELATPPMLPQEPAVRKEKSDADDEGLKGKVRSVTEESEDRLGTWGTQGRKMSSVEEYNESGFQTKRISYDSTGKPFEVTVYGNIDGARVSNWKSIRYDDDPPMAIVPKPLSSAQPVPRDDRYIYKYAYKYEGGRLVERQIIHNNGQKGMRYVTNYGEGRKEELVYDDNGKLNMKFVYRLDEKGNEIERTDVDVLGLYKGEDRKYQLRYESVDTQGNWTKKVTAKLVEENGKRNYKDWYVTYRTISYY